MLSIEINEDLNIISEIPDCDGMDLVLIADKTKSIRKVNFRKMKKFLVRLVSDLDISENEAHVAVMTYNKKPTILNHLNDESSYNKEALLDLIENIPKKLGSPTRTDRALVAADKELFTEAGGDRPDNPDVLVLFTDGRTHKTSQSYDEIMPSLKVS